MVAISIFATWKVARWQRQAHAWKTKRRRLPKKWQDVRKLTCPRKQDHLKRKCPLNQPSIFRRLSLFTSIVCVCVWYAVLLELHPSFGSSWNYLIIRGPRAISDAVCPLCPHTKTCPKTYVESWNQTFRCWPRNEDKSRGQEKRTLLFHWNVGCLIMDPYIGIL